VHRCHCIYTYSRASRREHTFVRPGGHAYARLRRALEHGHLWAAEDAARQLRAVSLDDALELVHLYAQEESPKFEAAARRWLGRYLEEREPTLLEVARMAAMLAERREHQSTWEGPAAGECQTPGPTHLRHQSYAWLAVAVLPARSEWARPASSRSSSKTARATNLLGARRSVSATGWRRMIAVAIQRDGLSGAGKGRRGGV
jgi:hypothetical protein